MKKLTNYIGKKFTFGFLVMVIMLIGAFALNTEKARADCFISSNLRIGAVGIDVQCLQTKVGANADGIFGPMTLASVKVWQASRGLVADGIVGPITKAALNNTQVQNPANLPAGCTSTVGYSPLTGIKCDSTGSSNLPAGCQPGYLYSTTTGMRCDGTNQTNNDPELEGNAGSINVSEKSTYSNEDVVAGEKDVKVMAFEIEADDGSDVRITSMKVELKQTVAGNSDRIRDYMDSVSIWMEGEKVGEATASSFSESSDIYTNTISLDRDTIIRAGEEKIFTVAVTAARNLDSGDIDDDSFEVDVLSIRFEDGEDVVTTENTDGDNLEKTFDFDDLATSGNLDLRLTRSSNSPNARVVEVDDTTSTKVTMLEFTLKAEGSDMTIDAIELLGTATGVDNTFADMVSEVALEADGDELDSISRYGDNVDDDTGDLWFTDLDFVIDEGDTVTFKVVARIRSIANGGGVGTLFDQGDTFTVSFPATSLDDTTNTDVEDENGDTVAVSYRTGSAIGEAQTFRSSGVNVTMGNVSYESITDSGNVTQVNYTIPLTISTFGDTLYLGLSADYEADTIDDTLAFAFELQDSSAPATGLEDGTVSSTLSCNASLEGGTAYRLDEGVTKNCTLQVIHITPGTDSRSYRVALTQVQVYTDSALTTGELIQTLEPTQDFQTGYRFISN